MFLSAFLVLHKEPFNRGRPYTNISRDVDFPDYFADLISHLFDSFGKFGRIGNGAEQFGFIITAIPVMVAAGNNHLVVLTWSALRQQHLNCWLPGVFLRPIAPIGFRDDRLGAFLFKRYVRDAIA